MTKELLEKIKSEASEYVDNEYPLPERTEKMSDDQWDEIVCIAGNQRMSGQIGFLTAASLYADKGEKEIERLKGLIERAHFIGYTDGGYKGIGRYGVAESFTLFKSENNL